MPGEEIIAGIAIAKIFGWIWDQFGKDIVKSSAKTLKTPWDKFNLKRAAEQYTEKMKEQHNIMQIWRMAKPVPLEGIFTHVNVLSQPSAFRHPSKHDFLEQVYLGQATFSDLFDNIKEERKDGLDAVRENQRLFILGKPGAGKTTFLKYTTLQTLAKKLNYVPIFIPLRGFSEKNTSLLNFIIDQFKICAFPDAQPFITTILSKGKAIVLCDGLDEVKKEGGLRKRIIQELVDFSKEYDESKFVITCRVAAPEYFFPGFTYVEMADFDEEQIQCFVTNWFKITDNPFLAEDTTERFLKECHESKGQRLWDLAKNPLLLTLLCLAYEETLSFPDRRSEIYEEALDALLKKWDTSRGIMRDEVSLDEVYHTLSLGRKRQMFARIAAETFEKGEYLFKQKHLEKQISAYLQGLPPTDKAEEIDAEAIIKAIEAQHGIFSERASKLYSFSHLTFQEYFTAKYIIENNRKDTLEGLIQHHCTDDKWREVFLLTAEMLDDAKEFFTIFLAKLDEMVRADERLRQLLTTVEQEAAGWQTEGTYFESQCAILFLMLDTAFFHFFDRDIACTSALASARDRAFALARARDSASDRDFVITPVIAFDSASARVIDSVSARVITRARTSARVFASDRAFANDLANDLASVKELSKEQGITDLYNALKTISVPSEEDAAEAWEAFGQTLLDIFQTHFSLEDYTFTEEQVEHVGDYLAATKLLLDCLEHAYVSDREAITDRLLRVPTSTDLE